MTSSAARKSPRYPTNEEYYMMYAYCVEHKNVVQNGTHITFRVLPKTIVKEFNADKVLPYEISDYHLKKAIDVITEWQILLNRVPEPQQTVLEDQLQAKINEHLRTIENQKLEIANLKKALSRSGNAEEVIKQAKAKVGEVARLLHAVTSA